jgi:hypothetical protein
MTPETENNNKHERTPEQDVREIERESRHLEQTMDQAREAVNRALRADSLAAPGDEHPDPQAAGREKDEEDDKAAD